MLVGTALLIVAARSYLRRGWKTTQSQALFWMAKGNSKIGDDLPTPKKILKDTTTVKVALLSSHHLTFCFLLHQLYNPASFIIRISCYTFSFQLQID